MAPDWSPTTLIRSTLHTPEQYRKLSFVLINENVQVSRERASSVYSNLHVSVLALLLIERRQNGARLGLKACTCNFKLCVEPRRRLPRKSWLAKDTWTIVIGLYLDSTMIKLLRFMLRVQRCGADIADEARTGIIGSVAALQREMPIRHVCLRVRGQRLIPLLRGPLFLHLHVAQHRDQHDKHHEPHATADYQA